MLRTARHWAAVMAELRNRDVRDIVILCCDGLACPPAAAHAGWKILIRGHASWRRGDVATTHAASRGVSSGETGCGHRSASSLQVRRFRFLPGRARLIWDGARLEHRDSAPHGKYRSTAGKSRIQDSRIQDSASPGGLLARLAAEGRPISHQLLDELPPSRNLHYIRQILVHTGVLPERHEDLERLPAWLDHHLAGTPAAHAALARPFLHWFLLRRARHRATVRGYPASAGRDLRRRVLVALDLLAWLDDQGLTLAELRQGDIDRWLDAGGSQRRTLIRYFLHWTAGRGLTHALTVPAIPANSPPTCSATRNAGSCCTGA